MTRKSDSMRNWILFGLTISTILLGGSLIAAPLRVSEWVRIVAIEQIDKRIKPLEVSLDYMLKEIRELKTLVKESIDRELKRGRRP